MIDISPVRVCITMTKDLVLLGAVIFTIVTLQQLQDVVDELRPITPILTSLPGLVECVTKLCHAFD